MCLPFEVLTSPLLTNKMNVFFLDRWHGPTLNISHAMIHPRHNVFTASDLGIVRLGAAEPRIRTLKLDDLGAAAEYSSVVARISRGGEIKHLKQIECQVQEVSDSM